MSNSNNISDAGSTIRPGSGSGSESKHHRSISGEHSRHQHQHQHHDHQDPEWLLRTGIALASSTREEKGQSWLAKRESSTSLVSDGYNDEDAASLPKYHHHHQHQHARFDRFDRFDRRKSLASGRSTPAAYSRHTSRSRRGSRRGSRANLTMTPAGDGGGFGSTGDLVHAGDRGRDRDITKRPQSQSQSQSQSGLTSPASIGNFPDFVDEHIRAEMEMVSSVSNNNNKNNNNIDNQRDPLHTHDDHLFPSAPLSPSFSNEAYDEEYDDEYNDDYDYYETASGSESESEDDGIDEQDLRRLTRERGFGLGGWLDRLVEWTLFGVHEQADVGGVGDVQEEEREREREREHEREHERGRGAVAVTTPAYGLVDSGESGGDGYGYGYDAWSAGFGNRQDGDYGDGDGDGDGGSEDAVEDELDEDVLPTVTEKPGQKGGWEDVGWLFNVVRRVLF